MVADLLPWLKKKIIRCGFCKQWYWLFQNILCCLQHHNIHKGNFHTTVYWHVLGASLWPATLTIPAGPKITRDAWDGLVSHSAIETHAGGNETGTTSYSIVTPWLETSAHFTGEFHTPYWVVHFPHKAFWRAMWRLALAGSVSPSVNPHCPLVRCCWSPLHLSVYCWPRVSRPVCPSGRQRGRRETRQDR